MSAFESPRKISFSKNVSKQMPKLSAMPPRPMPEPGMAAASGAVVCQAAHRPSAAAGALPLAMVKENPASKPPLAALPTHTCDGAHQSSPTSFFSANVSTPETTAEPTAFQFEATPRGRTRCAYARSAISVTAASRSGNRDARVAAIVAAATATRQFVAVCH